MANNKLGRFMAVPDNNAIIWKQAVGNLDGVTGYIFKWKNETGHPVIVQDLYVKFKTNTGTGTNCLVGFIGTTVEPTTLPTGTIVPPTAVSSATQLVVGVKDVEVPDGSYLQLAFSVDATTNVTVAASAAAVSGAVGIRYAMVPDIDQFA